MFIIEVVYDGIFKAIIYLGIFAIFAIFAICQILKIP